MLYRNTAHLVRWLFDWYWLASRKSFFFHQQYGHVFVISWASHFAAKNSCLRQLFSREPHHTPWDFKGGRIVPHGGEEFQRKLEDSLTQQLIIKLDISLNKIHHKHPQHPQKEHVSAASFFLGPHYLQSHLCENNRKSSTLNKRVQCASIVA